MSTFCPKCKDIIENLFNKSRYEPGKGWYRKQLPNILQQQFHILDNYRDIVSVSENCGLCALIKATVLGNLNKDDAGNPKLPDLVKDCTMDMIVRGGNKFWPAMKDGGLQLYDVTVGTPSKFFSRMKLTGMVNFSITAGKGMIQ
jgi:hypothetical protein